MTDTAERARRYLARMEPAISGSGSRPATFKAAVALVKGFALPAGEALPLLTAWNTGCTPPWAEKDLRVFLRDAEKSRKTADYLLEKNRPLPARDEAAEKRRKRSLWPAMTRMSDADLARVAALRKVSPEAVRLIHNYRFLWRCDFPNGEECLVIRDGADGAFAQRRRLDGESCAMADGERKKAPNLPGAEGAFLHPGGLGDAHVPVLLTEGAVSILETAEAGNRARRRMSVPVQRVAIAAAVSASSRFTEEALARLRGRRVRICGDADQAGQEAAARWTASLRSAGCVVDNVSPPPGCKDLGDALRQFPASHPYRLQLFTF